MGKLAAWKWNSTLHSCLNVHLRLCVHVCVCRNILQTVKLTFPLSIKDTHPHAPHSASYSLPAPLSSTLVFPPLVLCPSWLFCHPVNNLFWEENQNLSFWQQFRVTRAREPFPSGHRAEYIPDRPPACCQANTWRQTATHTQGPFRITS